MVKPTTSGRPYKAAHRPVTAALTHEEHAALVLIADAAGLAPSTYATGILRNVIQSKRGKEIA